MQLGEKMKKKKKTEKGGLADCPENYELLQKKYR